MRQPLHSAYDMFAPLIPVLQPTRTFGCDTGLALSPLPLGEGHDEGTTPYSVAYRHDTYGRFSSLSALASLRETNTFTYSYLANTDLISGMTASTGLSWARTFETNRDLITSVENRMILASNAEHVVTYAYDHQGRMVWKEIKRRDAETQSWGTEKTVNLLWDEALCLILQEVDARQKDLEGVDDLERRTVYFRIYLRE